MPRTGRRSGSSDPAHEAERDEHGRHHAARFSGFHVTDLYIVWSPVGKLSGKCCASQRAWYAIERLGFFGVDLGSLEGGGRLVQIPGGPLPVLNLVKLGWPMKGAVHGAFFAGSTGGCNRVVKSFSGRFVVERFPLTLIQA